MTNKLARQIGFEAAAIVFGAVLTYAAYRAVKGGGAESAETLLQYFWTAGALGAFIYMLLLIRLRKRIILPLREISDHAEDMSMGIFQKWEYPEFHSEMDQVATMLNLVANYNNRIQTSWRTLSFSVAPHMAKLRGCDDLPETIRADLEETWNDLRRMDVAIMGVFSPSPHFTEPRTIPGHGMSQHIPEDGSPRSENQPWNRLDQSRHPQFSAAPWEGAALHNNDKYPRGLCVNG